MCLKSIHPGGVRIGGWTKIRHREMTDVPVFVGESLCSLPVIFRRFILRQGRGDLIVP